MEWSVKSTDFISSQPSLYHCLGWYTGHLYVWPACILTPQ